MISPNFSQLGVRPRRLSIKRYHARFRAIMVKYKNQSAYRPNYLCETALLGKLIGTILLDLSKAFDLVNHDILLTK